MVIQFAAILVHHRASLYDAADEPTSDEECMCASPHRRFAFSTESNSSEVCLLHRIEFGVYADKAGSKPAGFSPACFQQALSG
jgi:hypothetical protein